MSRLSKSPNACGKPRALIGDLCQLGCMSLVSLFADQTRRARREGRLFGLMASNWWRVRDERPVTACNCRRLGDRWFAPPPKRPCCAIPHITAVCAVQPVNSVQPHVSGHSSTRDHEETSHEYGYDDGRLSFSNFAAPLVPTDPPLR